MQICLPNLRATEGMRILATMSQTIWGVHKNKFIT